MVLPRILPRGFTRSGDTRSVSLGRCRHRCCTAEALPDGDCIQFRLSTSPRPSHAPPKGDTPSKLLRTYAEYFQTRGEPSPGVGKTEDKGPPISSLMSNYDPKFKDEMPVKKNPREPQPGDDAGLRNRLSEAAVRGLPRPPSPPPQPPKKQQLPSLSSLFGPSSRPRQSPLRDGTGYFGSALPHAERHPISTSVPKGTFEPGFDEPPWVPPLPRPLPLPLSLRSREREQRHRPESRSDLGAGSSTWPTQGAASRSDYSLGSREHHLFASPEDVFATKLTGPRRDGDMISRNHEQFRTPVSAGPPEVMPVKDALGPKIWTGTHFLPRFVRQAEVPGEGLCYFYDDGSYCKTIIEGEQVNAHWGVTKAGKPRKRLAVACVTCREKKIKCDPDYPRCVQCEKFGRVCKYQSA